MSATERIGRLEVFLIEIPSDFAAMECGLGDNLPSIIVRSGTFTSFSPARGYLVRNKSGRVGLPPLIEQRGQATLSDLFYWLGLTCSTGWGWLRPAWRSNRVWCGQ